MITKWVCPFCGLSNVHVKAWVDLNTEVLKEISLSSDEEDYWCEDCSEHIRPELVKVKG